MSGAKLWDSPGMAVIYPQPAEAASLCLTGVLARLLFVRERMQTIQVICWRAQTDFGASSTSQSLRNVREDFFTASTALLFQKGTPFSFFNIQDQNEGGLGRHDEVFRGSLSSLHTLERWKSAGAASVGRPERKKGKK